MLDMLGVGLLRTQCVAKRQTGCRHQHGRGGEHEHPFQAGCVGGPRGVIHHHGAPLACLSDSRYPTSALASGPAVMILPRGARSAGTGTTTSPAPAWSFSTKYQR